MAWIESHQALRQHPKVHKLAETLAISKAEAIGHLHLLWWWCVDYAPDGNIKHNDKQLAFAAEFGGDSKKFVSALIDAGFVDRGHGVLTIHDWLDYCGELVSKRLARLKERRKLSDKRQKVAAKVGTNHGKSLPTNQPTIPTNQPTYGGAFRRLMDEYIRLTTPYKPDDQDPTQQKAVNACYKRFGKAASQLLDLALGDPDRAITGLKAVGARMQARGLAYTLETVCEHFPEYAQDPEAYNHETVSPPKRR